MQTTIANWWYRLPLRKGKTFKLMAAHRLSLLITSCLLLLLLFALLPGDSEQDSQLKLGDYQLSGAPITLEGIHQNASGLTFNPDTGTLFAVINNPTQMVELTTQGRVLRFIELKGFVDTEGLVYLGNNRFALLEEGKRHINLITIDKESYQLHRAAQNEGIALALSSTHNKGFEGIAVDHKSGTLFVVNEKEPRQLIKIEGLLHDDGQAIKVSMPWDFERHDLSKSDLAGLHFDAQSGHLLILSEESRLLSEVSLSGQALSDLSFSRLGEFIPQPEGVSLDDKGNLFIISEPNLLYRFSRS